MSSVGRTIGCTAALISLTTASYAGPLAVNPPLTDPKESRNLSGAACPLGPEHVCLMVADEGAHVRTFTLTATTLSPGREIPLVAGQGAKVEADAEAVASDDRYYYVVGSHGLSKSGKLQLSRFHVFRIPFDARTGEPSGQVEESGRLRMILSSSAPFDKWAEKPLRAGDNAGENDHGVNIEGAAAKAGRLYFAFRGPVLESKAWVLSVPAAALFSATSSIDARAIPIRLADTAAPDAGLRDIAALRQGFLLLTGPEAESDGDATIVLWDETSGTVRKLADVAHQAGAKPEALAVLREAPQQFEVLILSDGAPDGAPERRILPAPRP